MSFLIYVYSKSSVKLVELIWKKKKMESNRIKKEMILKMVWKNLKSFKHHVIVLGPRKFDDLSDDFCEAQIDLTFLDWPEGLLLGKRRAFKNLVDHIKKISPAVVTTWLYKSDMIGAIAARLAGIHVIAWNIRNGSLSGGLSITRNLQMYGLGLLSRFLPTKILSCATSAIGYHSGFGYEVDTQLFKPDPEHRRIFRKHLSISDQTIVVGLVGRWHPQKNIPLFIETCAALYKDKKHHYAFILAGADLYIDNIELKNLIKRHPDLDDHVYLLGPQREPEVVMNGIDILCCTSKYGEAFPNVLAEAMSCGTPCISTATGDAEKIIGRHGRISAPTAENFSQAIRNIRTHHDPVACRNHIVEHYSLEKMIAEYENFYFQATRNNNSH